MERRQWSATGGGVVGHVAVFGHAISDCVNCVLVVITSIAVARLASGITKSSVLVSLASSPYEK